jgi:hypothetical protein
MSVKNSRAREMDVEEAAATTECEISWTPRVDGARRRSRVNWRAMPPVAGDVRVKREIWMRERVYQGCPSGG